MRGGGGAFLRVLFFGLCGQGERQNVRKPIVATGTHPFQGRLRLHAGSFEQINQSVQPTRGNGIGLVVALGAAEPDLTACNSLLKIMGAEPDDAVGQAQPYLRAQRTVQPRISLGRAGPRALVQPGQNRDIGALDARLLRPPD